MLKDLSSRRRRDKTNPAGATIGGMSFTPVVWYPADIVMRECDMRPAESTVHLLRCGAVESILAVGVVSEIVCRVLHGINSAREASGAAWLVPSFSPLTELQAITSITRGSLCAMALVALAMLILRRPASRYLKTQITWTFSLRQYSSGLRYFIAQKSALVTWVLAVVGSILLVVICSHAHVDRTSGKPIVNWRGPLQDYVTIFAFTGYVFLAAACAWGLHMGNRSQGVSRFIFLTGILLALAAAGISVVWLIGPDD